MSKIKNGATSQINLFKLIVYKPFAPVVFSENSDHPLYWSQDCSVDDHRSLLVVTIVATKVVGKEKKKNNRVKISPQQTQPFIQDKTQTYVRFKWGTYKKQSIENDGGPINKQVRTAYAI